jgi:hypothetical protein
MNGYGHLDGNIYGHVLPVLLAGTRERECLAPATCPHKWSVHFADQLKKQP